MTPRVKIIIPEYGQRHHTQNCLDSIDRQVGIDITEVVVGNDGFTDGQPELTCETQLRVKDWQDNVLYGENVNRTAGYAFRNGLEDQDIIIILNNDTIFETIGVKELCDTILERKGIHGPLITNASWFAQDTTQSNRGNEYTESEVIAGCCLAMFASVWFELGGIDCESFQSYFEENDICRRAILSGFSVGFTHRTVLNHIGGQTYKPQENLEKVTELFDRSFENSRLKWKNPSSVALKYRGPGYSRIEE